MWKVPKINIKSTLLTRKIPGPTDIYATCSSLLSSGIHGAQCHLVVGACSIVWKIVHEMAVFNLATPTTTNMATQHSNAYVATCLSLNITFSITIVLLNKWIYVHDGFPNITMTCSHFIFTTIGLLICQLFGVFQPKSLPVLKMLPLSLTFCGFVVFTNLSLQTNSVGTYQLAKTMTTPCIILIQTYFYDRTFSMKVKFTLVSDQIW